MASAASSWWSGGGDQQIEGDLRGCDGVRRALGRDGAPGGDGGTAGTASTARPVRGRLTTPSPARHRSRGPAGRARSGRRRTARTRRRTPPRMTCMCSATRARPNPVPVPVATPSRRRATVEPLEHLGAFGRFDARPGVVDRHLDRLVASGSDRDLGRPHPRSGPRSPSGSP